MGSGTTLAEVELPNYNAAGAGINPELVCWRMNMFLYFISKLIHIE